MSLLPLPNKQRLLKVLWTESRGGGVTRSDEEFLGDVEYVPRGLESEEDSENFVKTVQGSSIQCH